MKAFTKMKNKVGLDGKRFTHWLPLFFGENDTYDFTVEKFDEQSKKMVSSTNMIRTKQRFELHLKNSFRYLCQGSASIEYTDENVLEIMPKLITTHVMDILKDRKYRSVLSLRRFFNFIRLFHYLIDISPSLKPKIESKVSKFISNPEERHRKVTSSLGDLLALATVTGQFSHRDFMKVYLEEQMVR